MMSDFIINSGKKIKKVFFCGIGGISMSGIAVMLSKLGCYVSGSDCNAGADALRLCAENGIKVFTEHSGDNVQGADMLVYSSAIAHDNCEILAARRQGIPTVKRSVLLGKLTDTFDISVGVAGTHGKSTVTAMIYTALCECGLSPTLLCGAALKKSRLSFAIGQDSTVVYEACEYDRSFLDMRPDIAVILNIEREHTDTYPTLADAEEAYFKFALNSRTVILNYSNPSCQALGKRLLAIGKTVRFFSFSEVSGAFSPEKLTQSRGFYSFEVGKTGVPIKLSVAGRHNVENALGAFLACQCVGAKNEAAICRGLSAYSGLARRFEYIGSYNGADVYDDYAHHPTEIKATLSSAKELGYKEIIAVFQSHTYSRTREFLQEFACALSECDRVIIAPVFAARELSDGVRYEKILAAKIKNAVFLSEKDEIIRFLAHSSHPQSLIITIGAGNVNQIAYALADLEKQRK